MYAVLTTGGKQYRVKTGDTVRVELLDQAVGEKLSFNDILLVGEGAEVKVGQPTVASASVAAEIIAQEKGPKIVVYKKKRRKQYDEKTGHRQPYTRLLITSISDGAGGKAELSNDERTKIMSNVGFAGDQWADDEAAEAGAATEGTATKAAKRAAAPKAAGKTKAAPKTAAAKKPAAKKAK